MQNSFSELLNQVITKSKVSKNELIRECDIDRSSFFKFLNGTRGPTNIQFSKICRVLQLSPSDEKMLRTAYSSIVLGEQEVLLSNRIADLLWMLEGTDDHTISGVQDYNRQYKNTDVIVNGKDQVYELITNTVLSEVHTREDYKLDLFLPACSNAIFKWLNSLLKSDVGRHVSIRQLVEFPTRSIDSDQDIVERLKFALLYAASYTDSYSGHYYYSDTPIDAHIGVFCAYSLITPFEVIVVNKRLDKAIIITDRKCRDEYENYFLTALNRSQPLISKVRKNRIEAEIGYPASCRYGIAALGDKQLKEGSILFLSPNSIAKLSERNKLSASPDNSSGAKEKQRLLKEIKKRLGSQIYLIDEGDLPPASSWNITLYDNDRIVYSRNDEQDCFVISEAGMVGLLVEFMRKLPNSSLVVREELALEILDESFG